MGDSSEHTENGAAAGAESQSDPEFSGGGPLGIREIAEYLQLSKSTVSRALADRPGPSAKTKARVVSAALALGYEPNELARSLTVGATMTVGYLARDIASPSLPPTLHGAESVLRAKSYAMLLLNSEGRAELDREHIRLLRRRRVDGLLLAISDEDDPTTHALLEQLPIPFVTVDRDVPPSLGASAVMIDLERGLRLAAKRLLELGHTRVAFVGGTPGIRPTKETLRVLRETFEGRDGSSFVDATGAFSVEHGATATRRLLDSESRPTAIVAGNTQILRGVLTVIAEHGLSVPGSVSVLCTDDAPFLEFATPAISVLQIDGEAVGQAAGDLLLARLAGGGPETRTIPTDFHPRESLAAPLPASVGRRSRGTVRAQR